MKKFVEQKFHIISEGWSITFNGTYVAINYKGKTFKGECYVHPEDNEKRSYLFGATIAYKRAVRKALIYEIEDTKKQFKIYRNLLTACQSTKGWDPKEKSAKIFYRQFNILDRRLNSLKHEKIELEYDIYLSIKQRDIVTNAIDRKKKQNKTK